MAVTTTQLIALLLGLHVCVTDLVARRVSNRGLLLVVVSAAVLQLLPAHGTPPLPSALMGMLIGLLVLLPFHAIGWMGAGDVKLFSAIGLLLGAKALLPIWLIASLAAGAHAALVFAWRSARHCLPMMQLATGSWQGPAWMRDWQMDLRAMRRGRCGIPYAAYLGIAMIGQVLMGTGHA